MWLDRLLRHFPHAVWLNPLPEQGWTYTSSVAQVTRLMEDRMYPLTPVGIDSAARELS